MPLAIFDLDGTLTRTTAVDGRCFLSALRQIASGVDPDPDWSAYPDVTDSGILVDVFSSEREFEVRRRAEAPGRNCERPAQGSKMVEEPRGAGDLSELVRDQAMRLRQ